MEASYLTASADGEGGRLPAKPRQIKYVARGPILEMTGKDRRSTTVISRRSCWSTSCGHTRT